MDPRERADATLARARARGAYVVTPESAISPMDAANTVQIPRTVVSAIDAADPDVTQVFPNPNRPHGEMPAIAQQAMTQSVPPPARPPHPPQPQYQHQQPPPHPPHAHTTHLPSQGTLSNHPVQEPVEGIVPTVKQNQPPGRPTFSQRLDG